MFSDLAMSIATGFTVTGRGDPAQVLAGKISSPEQIANIRKKLGVDQPYPNQLRNFTFEVFNGFTCTWVSYTDPEREKTGKACDGVRSWATNEEVWKVLTTRVGPTLTIMLPVLILETILGVLFALGVAYLRGSLTDRAIMVVCTTAMSISFLVYIIFAQWLFGFNFDAPGKSLGIPLGIEGGYALAGANNRPMLDLVAQFQFPSFLTPGSDGDVVNTNLWLASLQARFYLFL
mgnify:CR=1 FL=1